MFSDIEKAYRSGLLETRFRKHYFLRAVVAVALGISAVIFLHWNNWLVAGVVGLVLIGCLVRFVAKDMRQTIGKMPGQTLREKLIFYFEHDDRTRLETLASALKAKHIQTKDELSLVIKHFQNQQPVESKPNTLEWVISILIALISVVVLAYDESAKTIDVEKLLTVTIVTLSYAIIILAPIIVAALVHNWLQTHRAKVDLILIEDLSYIYVNFETFEDQLA